MGFDEQPNLCMFVKLGMANPFTDHDFPSVLNGRRHHVTLTVSCAQGCQKVLK